MLKIKGRTDLFTKRMVKKLWWPAMISAIGLSFGDMADALVVGQKMGETGLAAISICLPIYMVINVFIYGLGTGGSVRYTKLMGEGKEKAASDNFNHMLKGSLLLGIILAVAGNLLIQPILFLLGTNPADGEIYQTSRSYGRLILAAMPFFFTAYILNYYLCCEDREKLATVGYTVGNIMDIVFNILFVLVLNLGVEGAALSTILGQAISILFYFTAFYTKKRGNLQIRWKKLDFREVWKCFCIGLSSSMQFVWQMFFFILVNNILMRLFGENGVAVFDILQNMSYMILYIYEGTVKAMQPIVSTFLGERNQQSMKEALRLSLWYGTTAAVILMILICIVPNWICLFFGVTDPQTIVLGSQALRIYCTGAVCAGISIILQGYEQASGHIKASLLIGSLRSLIILFPAIFLCAALGKEFFWWCLPATEVLSLSIFLIYKKHSAEKESEHLATGVYRGLIENKTEELGRLMSEIETFCSDWNASIKQALIVENVAEEVCTAIMKKGFQDCNEGLIQLTLISLENGEFEFHIRDNALKFNPFSLETNKASMEDEFDMDAMGILMIKKWVKYFFYRQYQGFNTLIIRV